MKMQRSSTGTGRSSSKSILRIHRGGRAARLAVLIVPALLVVAAIAIGLALGDGCAKQKQVAAQRYHCPMHPTYVSDRPGDCPICGMRLVPIDEKGEEQTAAQGGAQGGFAGYAPVSVTEQGMKLAGIRTTPAIRGVLHRSIRAVGTVRSDERRIHQVTLKSAGYVERLFVGTTGQLVHQGDPILSIYSPDLLSAQSEYLRARQTVQDLQASGMEEVRRSAEDLLNSSKRKLELLDVPETLIREIERTGTPQRALTFTAPVSGYVTARPVVAGMMVEPGTELYTVTDLSKVWIEADVYENEAAYLKTGQEATLTLPYDPTVQMTGKIALIYPVLDPGSRTLRVRFETDNPGLVLKPGMFANAELQIQSADGIIVPDNAVLDTGDRQLVFVETSPGQFAPRSVRVGLRGDGQALLLEGVQEGDPVVVQANFLLDSESRIRAAFSGSAK